MRPTFNRKLLLLTILPLAAAQIVTMFAVMRTVELDVDRRARQSLGIGVAVVEEYLASRNEQLQTSVSVLAADFGLKEAVATTDEETIRSVLMNHGYRIGADVVMVVGLDGQRLAATAEIPESKFERSLAAFDADLPQPTGHRVEIIDGFAYDLYAVPLKAPTTIAWVIVGFEFGPGIAERIGLLTGLTAAIVDVNDNDVLYFGGPHEASSGVQFLATGMGPAGEVQLVGTRLGGYLALDTRLFPDDSDIRLVLLRSMRDAMAPYQTARAWLTGFTLVLLMLAAAASIWIARGISRPLHTLAEAVRDVMAGRYRGKVEVDSDDELGELAENFNLMRIAIAEREQQIRHRAQHDALTDLPNRGKIVEDLDEVIENAGRGSLAVLSLRLLRLNEISSTLGHDATDQLITTAARHLKLNLGSGNLLGHLSSNEFVLILPDHDRADAEAKAEKMQGLLATGVTLGRINIALQTEIGVAIGPEHGTSATELIRNAMIARTEAAVRGDAIAVYEAGRDKYYERQLKIVNDLRSAIQRRELAVQYQPQMALPSGKITGAEALVRWKHRDFGWLSPTEFVPAAEEAGTIMHLTRYVVGQAIDACSGWERRGRELRISVNISARDLQDEYLPYHVLNHLKTANLAPDRLTLEITENSVMQKVEQAIAVLSCLRDIGVRISMDDFGTGHSSLAQIRNIPLHELKIDRSFVTGLETDTHNSAIVRTTLALARQLRLQTVAEGVEDEDALWCLSSSGCNFAQGFFISQPLASNALLEWLDEFEVVSYEDRRSGRRAFAG